MEQETLLALGDDTVWVVRNTEPSDTNYGGWDVLVKDHEGVWACVGESMDADTARVMARVAYNVTDYR